MIDYEPLLKAALQRNLNVIASSNGEYEFGKELLGAFSEVSRRVTHFDLKVFNAEDLFLHPYTQTTESDIFPSYVLNAKALCFTSMESVDAEMLQAIEELLASRSLRGITLPNLCTVLVSYDFQGSADEIARLQKLAPAVTVTFS